jgi:uncharacterized FlaG/YvyC family protein
MSDGSGPKICGARVPETITPRISNISNKAETSMSRDNASAELIRAKNSMNNDTERKNSLSNISIHFNVDDETNKLVVVVTERESGRVIRTIPANELEKLQAGELLKWTA